MSNQPKSYTMLWATVDGTLLAEAGTVNLQAAGNSVSNTTIALGYAGETPGSPTATVNITNAVPSADFELDVGNLILSNKIVEIGIIGPGGKQATFKGTIIDYTLEYTVDGAASYAWSARGAMPKFE